MHISDGILTLQWSIAWYALALIFVAVGSWKIARTRKANPAYMSILALMGAAVFVISVWHIPVPVTGSSSHPNGTALAAIIIGPLATAAICSIVLFFQAFLGHGGITIAGSQPHIAWSCRRICRNWRLHPPQKVRCISVACGGHRWVHRRPCQRMPHCTCNLPSRLTQLCGIAWGNLHARLLAYSNSVGNLGVCASQQPQFNTSKFIVLKSLKWWKGATHLQ